MKVRLPIAFLLLWQVSGVPAAFAGSPETLKQASEDYWSYLQEESLGLRLRLGLKVEKLPDLSFEKAQAKAAFARALLRKLRRVREKELSYEERLSLSILREEAQKILDSLKYYWLTFPVTPYASPFRVVHRCFSMYRFQGSADLDRYIALLGHYARLLRAMEGKLREQERRGTLLPKEEVALVLPVLATVMKEGEASLFSVKAERLAALPETDGQQFQRRVEAAVRSEILPAAKNLFDFLAGDYSAKAPSAVGLWQYPGGKEFYRHLVKLHTTLDVSPEEVHRIGLSEVTRINGELEKIRQSLGFEGSMSEFRRYLKTDPRFFPKTPEEIGERLLAAQERIIPKVDSYFLKKPKAPYGVKRLEPALEGAMTFGYYQSPTAADPKGYYNYNGSNLKDRSLLNAAPLIYHELVPGHHFQRNLQHENADLPKFRREAGYTAYVEGWAEYASALAGEMGMYEDPYDLVGRLMMDMFSSTRLVVDTGMNYFGWPRSRAVEFMRENTLESDAQIETETLRYSSDIPGQALAYKTGSRKIRELRRKAQKALGPAFDIRKFHDAVLGSGAMPLTILERHIDRFVQQQKASSLPASALR